MARMQALVSPDGFVRCDGRLAHAPQVCIMSAATRAAFDLGLSDIHQAYRRAFRKRAIYAIGGIALHQAYAANQAWVFRDLDLYVPVHNGSSLDSAIRASKKACSLLGGVHSLNRFVAREGGLPGMRDVAAKAKCRLPATCIAPVVSVVFSYNGIREHTLSARVPALVAYDLHKPDELIAADHRVTRQLSRGVGARPDQVVAREQDGGRIAPAAGKGDGQRDAASPPTSPAPERFEASPKYTSRGVFANPLPASPLYQESILRGTIYAHRQRRTVREQRYRCLVTYKTHYKAGAAWQSAQTLLAAVVVGTGVSAMVRPVHAAQTVRTVLGQLSSLAVIGVGVGIAMLPNEHARSHQHAGGAYSDLERHWAVVQRQMRYKVVRQTDVDLEIARLQSTKAALDQSTPNAPQIWFRVAKSELLGRTRTIDRDYPFND
jgi:hypothetical protein